MVYSEETIRDEVFDKVLLYNGTNCPREEISSLREIEELEAKSYSENQNQHIHINIRKHLISCAKAISMNDSKIASELIKQIRKEASPIGDGIQRLACILVDGLEARLAGTGSVAYHQYVTMQVRTIDYLKAYYMLTRVSPVIRVSYHFANESILGATGNASKIHVVDFGITHGFQWPSLIQSLAKRKYGPQILRIIGVDLPRPGFHPAERINEIGRRLENYARSFGVPFEYQGIATQWDSICIDDLSIKDDEVLISRARDVSADRLWEASWSSYKVVGRESKRVWMTRVMVVLWGVWKQRNAYIFRRQCKPPWLLARDIKEETEMWLKCCRGVAILG
ncbi:scarecrow-like protein 9 [Carex rostrata]